MPDPEMASGHNTHVWAHAASLRHVDGPVLDPLEAQTESRLQAVPHEQQERQGSLIQQLSYKHKNADQDTDIHSGSRGQDDGATNAILAELKISS
jgi:hypothetical protein